MKTTAMEVACDELHSVLMDITSRFVNDNEAPVPDVRVTREQWSRVIDAIGDFSICCAKLLGWRK